MSMTLHFLNVGNGDCTIVEPPDGNLMMVDICNGGGANRQKTDPITYLGNRTVQQAARKLYPVRV